jgi:hypothetical protein
LRYAIHRNRLACCKEREDLPEYAPVRLCPARGDVFDGLGYVFAILACHCFAPRRNCLIFATRASFGKSLRALDVFPVPPPEELCIVLSMAGIIHGAPKHVEHTPIDGRPADRAELPIQVLGIGPAQVIDSPDTQVVQISSETRPDAGDLLQLS